MNTQRIQPTTLPRMLSNRTMPIPVTLPSGLVYYHVPRVERKERKADPLIAFLVIQLGALLISSALSVIL